MVEFALVVPAVLGIFLFTVDAGRGIFFYTQMGFAAREGARQAVLGTNWSSNTVAPKCNTLGTCQTLGVLPQLKTLTPWGFPVVYSDSTTNSTPPSYGTYTPNADPNQPGTIALTGAAANNTLYVFVYQVGPSTSPNPRWACPSCSPSVRTPGHQTVVVDLKMKWVPFTFHMFGFTSLPITLDAQTVQRMEW
jgi:hypothetical protein